MAGATHLVGRASELDSVDQLLAQVGEGRSAAEFCGAFMGADVAMVMLSMLLDILKDV